MKKDTTSYEQDIAESLENSQDITRVSELAGDIKNSQKLAAPSDDFRMNLKTRLADIYSIESSIESVPKLHILRNFMLFCSFFFIGGVVLFILDSRDNMVVKDEKYNFALGLDEEGGFYQTFVSTGGVIGEENKNDSNEKLGPLSLEKRENFSEVMPSGASESFENTNEIQSEAKISNLDDRRQDSELSSDLGVQQTSEPIESPESFHRSTESFGAASMMTDVIESDDVVENTVGDAGMRPEGVEDFTADTKSEEDIQWEDSQAIYEFYRMEFYEICRENNGVIANDDYTCEFESGAFCTVDNIRQDSSEPCKYLYEIHSDEK